MQQINKIAQPFPEILAICYFGELLACPGMTDQTRHDLTKASMDNELQQKMNFIPHIVFEILKFKKSCNLIGREHFGL